MVDPGFYFDGPRFFLEILVDPGLVDPGSEKLSFTLVSTSVTVSLPPECDGGMG